MVMRGVRELYLSLFVLFFRIGAGQWPAFMNADAFNGVTGLTVIESFFALSVSGWIESVAGRHLDLNRWEIVIAVLAIFCANYYFLIFKGVGVAFEKEFNHFPKSKRVALRLAAIGIVLAIGVFFFLSGIVFRRSLVRA
jgi:hypothetical protein